MRFALLSILVLVNSASAPMALAESNIQGEVSLIDRKNGIVKLLVKRKNDYSNAFRGSPSKTITYIDCNNFTIKDSRFDSKFIAIDRQSPGVSYFGKFCKGLD